MDLQIVIVDDCHEALRLVACMGTDGSPRSFVPMVWSRDPDIGFPLPNRWASGTCNILVDILDEHQEITLPPYTIAGLALAIVNSCLVNRVLGGFGGRVEYVADGVTLHVIVSSPSPSHRQAAAAQSAWMQAYGEMLRASLNPGQCGP